MVNQNKNKVAHTTNGNVTHYKILQINSSNCDFNKKLVELRAMINEHKSDIVLISEANADVEDSVKMTARAKMFPDFHIEDKLVTGNKRARCSVMVSTEIEYQRVKRYEDDVNSTLVVKVMEESRNLLQRDDCWVQNSC